MTFAIRGDTIGALGGAFSLTNGQVGWIMTGAFWGFTISILIGGQLCDLLGMGKILFLAFLAHIVGTFVIIVANGFWMLAAGTLAIGLANGFVEAAVNPLIATVYPDQKTHKLNNLHAWFPGGIVIGGLACMALTQMDLGDMSWKIKFATVLVPTIIYGILFLRIKFPETERVQSGVSTKQMYKEALRPLFLVWMFCMLLTAATELGTNQWIGEIMANIMKNVTIAGVAATGIIILVWINAIMCVGRLFAGNFMHKISPVGLLIGSAFFSVVGLYGMSIVKTAPMAFAASFVFALGVCYFWPTMLGVTSERFPKGGALLLGMMGAAGMLSSGAAQPLIGGLVDDHGPQGALKYVVVLPVVLVVIFTAFYLRDKAQGGYKIEKLGRDADDSKPEKVEV